MKAIEIIESLTQEPEIGKVYRGKVRRVEAYGAFVEILPGQDGLVHISELAPYRVRQTTDVVKEGDEVTVKIIAVDPMGKIKLSRKQAHVQGGARRRDGARARGRARRGRGPRRVSARRAGPGRAPRPLQPGSPRRSAAGRRGARADRKSRDSEVENGAAKAAPFYLRRTSTLTHQEGCGGRG